jgi:protein SCO1/2
MRHNIPLVHGNNRRAATGALAAALLLGLAGPVTGEEHVTKPGKATKSCCTPSAADAAPQAQATYRRSVEEVTIPDLTLVRMDGRKVALRDELAPDTPVMMNFIFTTCTTICPVMSATFSQVQEGLGEGRERVRMVSISIDPEQDTPLRLRDYARRHDAGPQWHFLTGSVEQINAVQRAFDAYRGSKFNHAALTFLRAPGDSHWVRVEGLVQAEAILTEYRKLEVAQ